MMATKHTPGPWFIDTSLHVYGTSEPRPLEEVPGGTVTDHPHVCTAKSYADAALIAAAPELLAASTDAVECAEILSNLMDSINKHGNYSVESTLMFLSHAHSCLSNIPAAIAKSTGSAA